MSGTKLLVVVLVVLVAAFVALTVMGANTNGPVKKTTPDQDSQDAQKFDPSTYTLTDSLGSLLGNFGPKLDPKQIKPPGTSFNLQAKQKFVVTVAADAGNQFRKAKFLMQPATGTPCAHITYVALNPPPQTATSLKNQDSSLNTQDSKSNKSSNPYQVSMAVLTGGGTITVERTVAGSTGICSVNIE